MSHQSPLDSAGTPVSLKPVSQESTMQSSSAVSAAASAQQDVASTQQEVAATSTQQTGPGVEKAVMVARSEVSSPQPKKRWETVQLDSPEIGYWDPRHNATAPTATPAAGVTDKDAGACKSAFFTRATGGRLQYKSARRHTAGQAGCIGSSIPQPREWLERPLQSHYRWTRAASDGD